MYGIYANIGGILMVNVTIYGIHGSYGLCCIDSFACTIARDSIFDAKVSALGMPNPTID